MHKQFHGLGQRHLLHSFDQLWFVLEVRESSDDPHSISTVMTLILLPQKELYRLVNRF